MVRVRSCHVRPTRRRRLTILECQVVDDSGPMKAVWFNQAYLADQLKEGTPVLLRGRLEGGRGGPSFRVAEHEIARRGDDAVGRHTTGLVPVYPATEGLSARRIRDFVWRVRGEERNTVEPLPAALRARARLPSRADSLKAAHWPADPNDVPVARRRLALEELMLFQLALVGRRRSRTESRPAERFGSPGPIARAGEARRGAAVVVHAAHGRVAPHRDLARPTRAVHGRARRRRAYRDRRTWRAHQPRVARQAQRRPGQAHATRATLTRIYLFRYGQGTAADPGSANAATTPTRGRRRRPGVAAAISSAPPERRPTSRRSRPPGLWIHRTWR